jgi:hypothetical protein
MGQRTAHTEQSRNVSWASPLNPGEVPFDHVAPGTVPGRGGPAGGFQYVATLEHLVVVRINYEPPNGTALQDLDVIPADLETNVTAELFDLAVALRIKIPTHRPQRSLFVFHVIALDCFDQFFDFVFHFNLS